MDSAAKSEASLRAARVPSAPSRSARWAAKSEASLRAARVPSVCRVAAARIEGNAMRSPLDDPRALGPVGG